MKISGFTIARNAIELGYPIFESIQSILPICDEFIVNVGDSRDGTLELIQSLRNNKIKIIQNTWDMSMGKEVLSYQTNLALKECKGDWAFYLQSDEVIHQEDLSRLKDVMQKHVDDQAIDALRFSWFHFYGSYFRYRIDLGWYQKQDRIIRNNGQVLSVGDAFSFERRDKKDLKRANTGCFLYHYGWVHPDEIMAKRISNAQKIGFASTYDKAEENKYSYGDLNRFPVYFGTHPKVMAERIARHSLSQKDLKEIDQKLWWHPAKILKIRYKTGKRVKERII